MIRYALLCEAEHGFEAWFSAASDFDDQVARGLVECPFCASRAVRKAIMAPAVHGARKRDGAALMDPSLLSGPPAPEAEAARTLYMEAIEQVRKHVEENFDHVGDAFAREARAIHEGRSEVRAIYGEATAAEVEALRRDQIPVAPLPSRPRPKSKLN